MANYNLGSVQGEIEIDYDNSGVKKAKADVAAAAKQLEREKFILKLDADAKVLNDKLTAARAELARLSALETTPEIDADINKATAAIATIEAQLAALNRQKITIQADVDQFNALNTMVTKLNSDLDNGGKSVKTFRAELSDFGSDVRNVKEAVSSLGDSLSVALAPTVFAGAASAAGDLLAALAPVTDVLGLIPGAAVAAALSFGTVKLSVDGMGDAISAVNDKDLPALKKAMEDLSPSAQQFVAKYAEIKPTFDKMQGSVQEAFFKGLGQTMGELADIYIPAFNTGLTNIAAQMNQTAKASADVLMKPDAVQALNTVLANTADMWGQVDFAAGSFLVSFLKLAAAGSQFFPAFSNALQDGAIKFQAWTDAALKSGSFVAGISAGLDVLGKLIQTLINVGSTVGSVINAIRQDTGGVAQSLVEASAAMAAWAKSAEGQDKIREIFSALRQIFEALLGVLPILAGVLSTIVGVFNSLPGPLQDIVANMLVWGGVIGVVMGRLSPLIAIVSQIGPAIGLAVKAFKTMKDIMTIVQIAFIALRAVMLANPFIAIAAAIIALVILVVTNWDTIMAALSAAWEWIKSTAATVWNAIVSFFSGIWDGVVSVWNTVWGAITGFFSGIWNGIKTVATTVWNAIVAFFTTIWNAVSAPFMAIWNGIVAFLQGAWNVIFNILRFAAAIILAIFFTIWNPVWAFIQWIWGLIVSFLTTVWTGIVTVATTIWTALVEFFTMIWTAISDVATTVWTAIVDFFTTIWDAVSSAFQTVWNAIVDFLTPIWEAISSTAETIWNAITDAISAAVDAVWSVIQTVWNAIWGFLEPIWNTISSVASSVFNAIASTLSSIWNSISSAVTSVWNTIAGFFTSIWNTISTAVSSGATKVWDFLTSLWDKIKGVAGEAINWLVDAGKNIIQGLWNGIKSMGAWLYDTILGWIKSVVPGPILSFLGIASPSKWMRDEVGRMIPQGIMVGMQADEKGLIAQAKALAENTANAATSGSAVGNLALAANGNHTAANALSSSLPNAGAGVSNASTVNLGGVTLQIAGNLDPTNEVLWRDAMANIQDGLMDLEKSYG